MLDKKKFRKQLGRIYSYKRISHKKYNAILSMIEEYKESDPFFYNYQMGKFITTFGNPDDAIEYLLTAKDFSLEEKGKVEASIYYNLYKCYLKKGEYNEAFTNLADCNELSGDKGDFTFALNMLGVIVAMDMNFNECMNLDSIVENGNKLYFSEIRDQYCKELYNMAIDYFNSKDYTAMLETLKRLKDESDEKKHPIEVDSLVLLAKTLKDKKEKHFMDEVDLLNDENIDLDDYIGLVGGLLDSGMSVKKFFVDIEKYINTDLEKAIALYDLIVSRSSQYYVVEMSYLNNSINERKEYFALGDDVRGEYEKLKELGDKAFKARNFVLAEEKYREAYEVSNLKVCEYYIGKALFKQGKLGKAKQCLNKYALNGGSKYDKCLLYLSSINTILKNNSTAKKQVNLMLRINESFQKDFVYKGYRGKKKEVVDDPDFDKHKNRVSKRISVSETDFEERTTSTEDFYDCDLDGKLSIIRELYRHGQANVANHLLNELGPLYSKADVKKVEQFQKNKKIYMNQRRTS